MSSRTLFIDFDGTIVEFAFPGIGEPMPHAFRVMKRLQDAGYKLALWTCREDEGYKIEKQYLTQAVEFCRENGIEFDAVNEGLPEDEFRPEGVPRRKPHGHMVIDDRNFLGFPGWLAVEEWFFPEESTVEPVSET